MLSSTCMRFGKSKLQCPIIQSDMASAGEGRVLPSKSDGLRGIARNTLRLASVFGLGVLVRGLHVSGDSGCYPRCVMDCFESKVKQEKSRDVCARYSGLEKIELWGGTSSSSPRTGIWQARTNTCRPARRICWQRSGSWVLLLSVKYGITKQSASRRGGRVKPFSLLLGCRCTSLYPYP